MNLAVATKPSLLPYGLATAPGRFSMDAAHSSSLSTYAHPKRRTEQKHTHHRAYVPLSILQQRQFAKNMVCRPAIFTAAFVESMTSAEIAKLLTDCFYDLCKVTESEDPL